MSGDYTDWEGARPVIIFLDPGDDSTGPKRLRNENGALVTIGIEAELENILSGSLNVSTLTPVVSFKDLSAYTALVFEGWTDSADQINFLVERSPDGTHADVDQDIVVITVGKAGHIEKPVVLSQYWRVSAYTDSPFPVSVLSWKLRGLPRSV